MKDLTQFRPSYICKNCGGVARIDQKGNAYHVDSFMMRCAGKDSYAEVEPYDG